MGVGGQPHAPAASSPGKDPVPIVQEAGWAPEPVWVSISCIIKNFQRHEFRHCEMKPVFLTVALDQSSTQI